MKFAAGDGGASRAVHVMSREYGEVAGFRVWASLA